ncbi:MAG: rhombosortase, partial [Rubrivivax sp.]
ALGALLAPLLPAPMLEWQSGHETQLWRWVTASFVHHSPAHLLANLAGCAAVSAFVLSARLPSGTAWSWWIAWPLGNGLLALWPEVARFGGASGTLHAGLAAAAVVLACTGRSRRRVVGLCVLGGLAAKTWLEQPWVQAIRFSDELGIPVAVAAHLCGVLSGVAGALAVLGLAALRRAQPPRCAQCGFGHGGSVPGAPHPEGDKR